ncbi:uncharacterized protein Dg isoform X2 [Chironomus tepperi]|uniref:uncharacterized protein Dg isoform X2 n=1 Tax=Chironomus tepperi TaxID=113505 RepID=UPI00391F1C11
MIFKRRFNATFIVLLFSTFVASERRGEEYKVNVDDLQVVYSDPPETVITPPSRYLYSKEIAQCPSGESKMMLTLLLQSLKWSDVGDKKKEKAIKKMSRFFHVPVNYIKVDDVHTPEMLEMLKHSINKSNNLLNTKETVGRIEFPIGCGDKLFSSSKSVAHKINEYVKSEKLQELSGLPFHWWNIWSKHLKSRVQRTRRQADGSGEGEVDDYEEYDETDQDIEEGEDENTQDTLPDNVHSYNNQRKKFSRNEVTTEVLSTPQTAHRHDDELPIVSEIEHEEMEKNHGESDNGNNNVGRQNFGTDYQISPEEDMNPVEEEDIEVKEEISIPGPVNEIEEITQRTSDSAPTPIGSNEILKLENDVAKTIENDNNVGDVPPQAKQPDDKILEEWAQNVFSHAPKDEVTSSSEIQSTVLISTTTENSRDHYHENVPLETTIKEIVEEAIERHQEIQLSTADIEEILKETLASTIGMTSTTISNAQQPESETIFTPINNTHNEHINVFVDEKLPIVTSATVEIPSTTSIEQELISVTPSTTSTAAEKKSEEESNYDDEYDDEDTHNEEDTYEESLPTEKSSTSFRTTIASRTTSGSEPRTPPPLIMTPQDDDDDDDQETEIDESIKQLLSSSSLPPTTTTTTTTTPIPTTVTTTTTVATTTTTLPITTTTIPIVEFSSEASESELPDPTDYDYLENQKPYVAKRLNRLVATSGKTFTHKIEGVFNDHEDGTNLSIELLDKNNGTLSSNSWIRFNPKTQELYGLPLENDVSKHEFKLRATDSGNEHVDEIVEITVHQHKTLRSVNHEIYIQVTIEKDYESIVDWEIRLIRGIIEALDDKSVESIFVRDVKPNKHNKTLYTFVYSNDTLPKDTCPKAELDKLMLRLTKRALSDVLQPEITVRNVERDLINSCAEVNTPRPPPSPPNTKNFPPTVRNAIDKISATVGQLLVFVVPKDTFYDPEDLTELKLTLLNEDRSAIDPSNWLQFDAKNQEFYGVPGVHDKTQQYVLVAEDKNGLTTNDALVVDVHNTHSKRDYSAAFEYQLEIGMEQFQNPSMKRKFIERLQQFFHDSTTDSIVIKSVKKLQYLGRTAVVVQNTTLHHSSVCPSQDILALRNRLVRQDGSVKATVKEAIGNEFNVQKITVSPTGKCTLGDTYHHHETETGHVDRPDEKETPIINQDVLITYVLPSAIILLMLLIALLIACLLYKRRNTGKMELGDEEERKSFRTKGIPVIFQDELDEKPEIVTKSPVILKDEKPPLLPQYNGMSQDGEDDNVDQYIPPQPLLMGSRESRGKSPVTPSYRKPPPKFKMDDSQRRS